MFIHVNIIYILYMFIRSTYFVLCCHTKRVSGIQSCFRYMRVLVSGMYFDPNQSSGRVRVSILGAQTLHPIQIRPLPSLMVRQPDPPGRGAMACTSSSAEHQLEASRACSGGGSLLPAVATDGRERQQQSRQDGARAA